jgi:hypothetical protein
VGGDGTVEVAAVAADDAERVQRLRAERGGVPVGDEPEVRAGGGPTV